MGVKQGTAAFDSDLDFSRPPPSLEVHKSQTTTGRPVTLNLAGVPMKTLAAFCTTALVLLLMPHSSKDSNAERCATPADDQAIAAIADTWRESYNAGDAAKVAGLYSKNAYYLTQHYVDGIVHTRPFIQAYVQRGAEARYHIDSIETLSTVCDTDFAYAITRYRSTNGDQKAMGVNLVVMRKIEGKWLIVAHESAVPDPATAIQTLTPIGN